MINAGRFSLVLGIVVVLIVAPAGSAALAGNADGSDEFGRMSASTVQDAASDHNDSDTVRHRHPNEYDEDGDLAGIEGWLVERMTAQLGDSATRLSEGEYDRASQLVGEEYRKWLRQYVVVSEETDGEGNAALFERGREEQVRTINAVRRYHETRDAYERARENGDDERARELARELEDLARTVADSSGKLQGYYEDIENETGTDLSESDAAIERVNEEIQAEQAEIRAEEFVQTELVIESDRTDVSFLDPLVASGRLHTADGEPVSNEEIQLFVGNGSVQTVTDANGEFEFEYRPTDVPTSTTELEIRYVPDNESMYLGSETTVAVSIEPVEPTVTIDDAPEELAYGDAVGVQGELYVDEIPVDDTALVLLLGEERIGTVNVTNGSFDGSGTVPASIPDGERNLTVRLDNQGEERALSETASTTNVTVLETESVLTVDTRRSTGGSPNRTVDINGTLETVHGDGVGDEPIHLRAGETTLQTVVTDDDGSFDATVQLPEGISEDEVRIVAAYDGRDSNIGSADAASVVRLSAGTAPRSAWPLSSVSWFAVALVAVAGTVVVRRFRRRRRRHDSKEPPEGDRPDVEREDSGTIGARSLFDRATTVLSSGLPTEAVEIGYAAVRSALSPYVDDSDALTPREFYRSYRDRAQAGADRLPDVESRVLRHVTETYERAVFGPESISSDDAESVLERTRQLCGPNTTDESDPNSDSND